MDQVKAKATDSTSSSQDTKVENSADIDANEEVSNCLFFYDSVEFNNNLVLIIR